MRIAMIKVGATRFEMGSTVILLLQPDLVLVRDPTNVLREGRFDRGAIYTENDEPSLHILPDVKIALADVFAD